MSDEGFNIGIFWFHFATQADGRHTMSVTDADDQLIAMVPGFLPACCGEPEKRAFAATWMRIQCLGWLQIAEKQLCEVNNFSFVVEAA